MAFYDFFLGGARQLQAHITRLSNRNTQADDREASARWLSEKGTDEAVYGLFGRFDLQVEHMLKDRNEKELVVDLLVSHGSKAVEQARKFAAASPNFQYAVRVVQEIKGEAAAVDMLLDLLGQERLENELKPEKKRHLLIALAERKDARIVSAAARFLADYDEGVRAGAVEALAAQEGDEAQPHLWTALLNRKEESTRIRGRIAEVFAKRTWPIDPEESWLPNHLPGGYRLLEGRIVHVR